MRFHRNYEQRDYILKPCKIEEYALTVEDEQWLSELARIAIDDQLSG